METMAAHSEEVQRSRRAYDRESRPNDIAAHRRAPLEPESLHMILRPARPSDAAAVAALAIQLGYPSQPEEAERRLQALAERSDHAVLVAETDDSAVVAWCHVAGRLSVETEPFAEILGLVVDESQRGRRIGEKLVEATAEWAIGKGYKTLRVRSNAVRERTHRFYERLGFSRVKSQVVLSRALVD